jgi:DNA repair/transcription protein MET18/MMS19
MGDEFLSGYVNLSNGEKDPRNLLLCFAICRVILIEFQTNNFVEVMTIFVLLSYRGPLSHIPNRLYSTLRSVIFQSLIDSLRTIHLASRPICSRMRCCKYSCSACDLLNSKYCLRRSCMNACPAFGPLATSVFVEKLTAGYPLTKVTLGTDGLQCSHLNCTTDRYSSRNFILPPCLRWLVGTGLCSKVVGCH